ncbi:MAG TPA: helix-turn-helix transcriptional regulator [Acidimicrobiales bacterium]|nr:helix-turn-helix transcriptional regulator [Acidimicrobiales bacterium]
MSLDGQCPPQSQALVVVSFPMPRGSVFDWHTHTEHQLAWAPNGVLLVRTGTTAWVLPPTRALWIPAGVRHEVLSTSSATMQAVYVRPDLCPITWEDCTPVAATPLLGEMIGYLATEGLDADARGRGEAVVVDLLRPVTMQAIDVPMPHEPRAGEVAEALRADPCDGRTLDAWGHEVGASERTLARAFLSDTGLSFGRWRTRLRLRAALGELAAGAPVSTVARSVGYESASAFVAAFRRETGVTPSAYFRAELAGAPGTVHP